MMVTRMSSPCVMAPAPAPTMCAVRGQHAGSGPGLFSVQATWFHTAVVPGTRPRDLEASRLESTTSVVIGLGANLGDPRAQLQQATSELASRLGSVRASGLYASAAIGPEQPDFMNAALLVSYPAPLHELLRLTREVEHRLGRRRDVHWGPRVIDLDLLWAGDRTSSDAELIVPHPQLTRRAFALLPLLELCPEAVSPLDGAAYRSFLSDVHSQRIERVSGPEWCLASGA